MRSLYAFMLIVTWTSLVQGQTPSVPEQRTLDKVTRAVQDYILVYDRPPASLKELWQKGYIKRWTDCLVPGSKKILTCADDLDRLGDIILNKTADPASGKPLVTLRIDLVNRPQSQAKPVVTSTPAPTPTPAPVAPPTPPVATPETIETVYTLVTILETNARNQIERTQPASGSMVFTATGRFRLQYQQLYQGTFAKQDKNPYGPDPMYTLTYDTGQVSYAYVRDKELMIWTSSNAGRHTWLKAVLQTSPPPPVPATKATGTVPMKAPAATDLALNPDGFFKQFVLYGHGTFAFAFQGYDSQFTDTQQGIIFFPDGIFRFRCQVGNRILTQEGQYWVTGQAALLEAPDGTEYDVVFFESKRLLEIHEGQDKLGSFAFQKAHAD